MPNMRNIYSFIGLFLVLFSAIAQSAPSLSDYGALPTTQMVAISPNGEMIAYRKVTDKQDAVFVISLVEKKTLLAIDVSSIQPQYLDFFNDDQLQLNISEYRRAGGTIQKFDLSTAYVLNIKTKKIRQLLIPGVKIHPAQSGLGRVIGVTADGKYALMPAYSPVDHNFPKPKYALYKVDLNRTVLKTADRGDFNTDDFFVDAKGDPIVRIDFDERNEQHTVYTKKDGDWVAIFNEETEIRNKWFAGLTPDFKSLVVMDTDEASGRRACYTMSLADGKIVGPLYGRDDADIAGAIVDIQRVVQGVRYSGFTPYYQFFNPVIDTKIKEIQKKFPQQSVWISSWSPDWKHVVVNVEGSSYADDYFLFSDGKEPEYLTTGRPQITENDINPIGKATYVARDGLKIPTLITIPRDKLSAMKNLPAIIYPHGGPAAYDMIGFDFIAQALAAQGYLVIQPQFRGSTGFGDAHYAAGHGEWGKKMQDDLTDAVKFFASKGYIDPTKVCIIGASYGGYAALAGGAFTPDVYKCVVSINGIADINSMLAYDKNRGGSDSELAAYMEMQFANGKVDKKELVAISPENHAKNFIAPVLLIHSVNDKRVPIKQSAQMLSALKKEKKEAKLIELEGDNHHLLEGPTRQQAVEETIKFVNAYLKQ